MNLILRELLIFVILYHPALILLHLSSPLEMLSMLIRYFCAEVEAKVWSLNLNLTNISGNGLYPKVVAMLLHGFPADRLLSDWNSQHLWKRHLDALWCRLYRCSPGFWAAQNQNNDKVFSFRDTWTIWKKNCPTIGNLMTISLKKVCVWLFWFVFRTLILLQFDFLHIGHIQLFIIFGPLFDQNSLNMRSNEISSTYTDFDSRPTKPIDSLFSSRLLLFIFLQLSSPWAWSFLVSPFLVFSLHSSSSRECKQWVTEFNRL